jgi:hypothetical protein
MRIRLVRCPQALPVTLSFKPSGRPLCEHQRKLSLNGFSIQSFCVAQSTGRDERQDGLGRLHDSIGGQTRPLALAVRALLARCVPPGHESIRC